MRVPILGSQNFFQAIAVPAGIFLVGITLIFTPVPFANMTGWTLVIVGLLLAAAMIGSWWERRRLETAQEGERTLRTVLAQEVRQAVQRLLNELTRIERRLRDTVAAIQNAGDFRPFQEEIEEFRAHVSHVLSEHLPHTQAADRVSRTSKFGDGPFAVRYEISRLQKMHSELQAIYDEADDLVRQNREAVKLRARMEFTRQ